MRALLCTPSSTAHRMAAFSSSAAQQQRHPLAPWRRQRRQAAVAPAAAASWPFPLADLVAGPAAASEAFIDTTAGIPDVSPAPEAAAAAAQAAAEAAAAAAAAAESDPAQLVFTALFGVAIAALSVVTLGVAYLSFTSWNDSRIEAEDRRRVDNFRPSSNGASPAAAKKAAAKKEREQKREEEFKGFGSKK